MKCCLCGKDAGSYGNNAEPIMKGRCCDSCNIGTVTPIRSLRFFKEWAEIYRNQEKKFNAQKADRGPDGSSQEAVGKIEEGRYNSKGPIYKPQPSPSEIEEDFGKMMFNEGRKQGIQKAIDICNEEIKRAVLNIEKVGMVKVKQKLNIELKSGNP